MKKRKAEAVITAAIWLSMAVLAVYIVIKGLALDRNTVKQMMYQVQQQAIETYFPGITREYEKKDLKKWILDAMESCLPLFPLEEKETTQQADTATASKIVEENTEFLQAKLLEENQEAKVLRSWDMKIQEV